MGKKAKIKTDDAGELSIKGVKIGQAVKVLAGTHEGQQGTLKHLRALTGEAHVEVDGGKVVNVAAADLAAA